MPGQLEGRAGKWRTTPVSTIIGREWKMLEYLEDGRRELYRIGGDISESHDMAAEKPEIVKTMTEALNRWHTETGAAMPTPKPAPAEKTARKPTAA